MSQAFPPALERLQIASVIGLEIGRFYFIVDSHVLRTRVSERAAHRASDNERLSFRRLHTGRDCQTSY